VREILEQMQEELVSSLDDVNKSNLLFIHDGIGRIIDKAEEFQTVVEETPPASIVQVASVSLLRDTLNECLSNALTPLPMPKVSNAKRRAKRAAGLKRVVTMKKASKRKTGRKK